MFLLVFAISEGGTYGWWEPNRAFNIAGVSVWPESFSLSLVPAAFVAAAILLTTFVVVERRKERAGRDPLFEFSELRHRGFRFGLVTTGVLAMGQLALVLVLSVFLQGAARLERARRRAVADPDGCRHHARRARRRDHDQSPRCRHDGPVRPGAAVGGHDGDHHAGGARDRVLAARDWLGRLRRGHRCVERTAGQCGALRRRSGEVGCRQWDELDGAPGRGCARDRDGEHDPHRADRPPRRGQHPRRATSRRVSRSTRSRCSTGSERASRRRRGRSRTMARC